MSKTANEVVDPIKDENTAFTAEVKDGEIVDEIQKTPEEIQREEQQKILEEKQEKIVINVREKILPVLKENNSSVENSKLVCDLLQVAITQGQVELFKDHKVGDLKLLDFITDGYPESKAVREILEKISDLSMMDGINSLQWMVAKINKVLENENKERKFEDLGLDF